jgi:hypothetical protein
LKKTLTGRFKEKAVFENSFTVQQEGFAPVKKKHDFLMCRYYVDWA